MSISDWFRFRGTRGAILRQGEEQARRFGSTTDFVAREFVRRSGLSAIPAPVWQACLRNGTCPAGLTAGVRDLLCAHVIPEAQEYAPQMVACALQKLGDTFKDAVGISLVKLIAPSVEKEVPVSVGAAAVLSLLVFLERSSGHARSFRRQLSELTRVHLPGDHDYIWMKCDEAAEALNLD